MPRNRILCEWPCRAGLTASARAASRDGTANYPRLPPISVPSVLKITSSFSGKRTVQSRRLNAVKKALGGIGEIFQRGFLDVGMKLSFKSALPRAGNPCLFETSMAGTGSAPSIGTRRVFVQTADPGPQGSGQGLNVYPNPLGNHAENAGLVPGRMVSPIYLVPLRRTASRTTQTCLTAAPLLTPTSAWTH